VKPDTVIRWHRKGFRLYWRFLSRRKRIGRPVTGREARTSLHTMENENPTWRARGIHGELLKVGFKISERTVSRYVASPRRGCSTVANVSEKLPGSNLPRWIFSTVIKANFRILYYLFLIHHNRREVIHFNVTEHPTGEWVVQQLREAFPESTDDQYLIFDRDTKFR
jgi:putative transposase